MLHWRLVYVYDLFISFSFPLLVSKLIFANEWKSSGKNGHATVFGRVE